MNDNRRRIELLLGRKGTRRERPGDRGELAQRQGDLNRAVIDQRPCSTGAAERTGWAMTKYKGVREEDPLDMPDKME